MPSHPAEPASEAASDRDRRRDRRTGLLAVAAMTLAAWAAIAGAVLLATSR